MRSSKSGRQHFRICLRIICFWIFASLILLQMVSACRGAPAVCVQAPSALVGWWSGDGNATDLVGGNNGSLQGGATASAAGFVGSAFGFDGISSYVQVPDSAVFHPSNLTIEAWV